MNISKIDKLILEGLLLTKTDLSDEEVERERKWMEEVTKLVRKR